MASQDSIINIASLIEENWCNRINKLLERDLENDPEMPITIFRVSISLVATKPEAYSPQVIALGPYHHLQPELQEMEHHKVGVAKKANKLFQLVGFQQLIEETETKLVPSIRSCYRGHLALQNKTLAMIMAIDGLFLLGLLKTLDKENGRQNSLSNSSLTKKYNLLVHSSGKRLPQDAILKDVLMLENQIPFFVLKEIISAKASNSSNTTSSSEDDDLILASMLVKLCQNISPIKLTNWSNYSSSEVVKHHHLLDILYQSITFKPDCEDSQAKASYKNGCGIEINSFNDVVVVPINNSNVFSKLWARISTLNIGRMKIIKKVIDALIHALQMFGISSLAFLNEKKVLIPSVSELCSAQVKFCPEIGGTKAVRFDEKCKKFHLPIIVLNPTSDVLMRNLVAYETVAKSESLNFKRYTELMSAIVDTSEDVELLRRAKVLESELSDAEILEIFNGMTKSMESKDRVIDEAINGVNRYYNNTEKVKAYRLMKKYIYSSWKILTVFASMLLLLLMAMQTFCDVYSCPSLLSKTKTI